MVEKKDEMMSVMADALANTKARHPDCRGPFKIEFPEDRATTPTASELVEAALSLANQADHCVVGYACKTPNIGGAMQRLAEASSAVRAALANIGEG